MKGTALVKSFLTEHKTDMQRLFNTSTERRKVALRAKLIRALHDDGLSYSAISRVLEIDVGTVRYWLIEKERRAKMRSCHARVTRFRRRAIYHWWDDCAQALAEARA